jgi:glutathione S-transferase
MRPETNQEKGASASGSSHGPIEKPKRLELYFFPECPYCRKVMTAIDDLGLRQRVVFHDARNDPEKKKELVDRTGKTQVPCLVVDGKPMHESEDIKQYLHRTFGG